ncbi:hypothetical protein E4U45_000294 [Claviceps purpurea]|nr:hypothetical protein E4U45_000294 [Claviceps purpurea]
MRWRRHPQALTFSGRSGHTSADPVASTLYFPLSVLPPVVFPLFQVCSAAPNARGDKIGQPRQPTPLFLVHTFFPSRPPSTSTKPLVNISVHSVFEPFHSVLSPRRCPGALPWLRWEPPSMASRQAIGRTTNGLNEAILAPITLFMSQRLLIILSRP